MRTIAFDVMGADVGVTTLVNAALEFVGKNLNYAFILVGDASEISKTTKETERIRIIDAPKVIDAKSGARISRDSQTSMATAIRLVRENKADAVISSGSSAAYLTLCALILQRMENISRPAFMTILPTIVQNKRLVLLDCGANLSVDETILVQWTKLGLVFSQSVLGVQNPQSALINVGTEDEKGLETTRQAHAILKNNPHYRGFIESRYLFDGEIDVAIVDGYGGNLIIKAIQGTNTLMFKALKQSLQAKIMTKIGAFLARKAFHDVKERFDYRNIGGAWVVGLNGLAIKTHGSSDKKAFIGAFNQVALAIDNGMLESFKKAVEIEHDKL